MTRRQQTGLKNDGTPDMRTTVGRQLAAQSYSSYSSYSNYSYSYGTPITTYSSRGAYEDELARQESERIAQQMRAEAVAAERRRNEEELARQERERIAQRMREEAAAREKELLTRQNEVAEATAKMEALNISMAVELEAREKEILTRRNEVEDVAAKMEALNTSKAGELGDKAAVLSAKEEELKAQAASQKEQKVKWEEQIEKDKVTDGLLIAGATIAAVGTLAAIGFGIHSALSLSSSTRSCPPDEKPGSECTINIDGLFSQTERIALANVFPKTIVFEVRCYLKIVDISQSMTIIDKSTLSADRLTIADGFRLYLHERNIVFEVSHGDCMSMVVKAAANHIADGNFHTVTAKCEGSSIHILIDGVKGEVVLAWNLPGGTSIPYFGRLANDNDLVIYGSILDNSLPPPPDASPIPAYPPINSMDVENPELPVMLPYSVPVTEFSSLLVPRNEIKDISLVDKTEMRISRIMRMWSATFDWRESGGVVPPNIGSYNWRNSSNEILFHFNIRPLENRIVLNSFLRYNLFSLSPSWGTEVYIPLTTVVGDACTVIVDVTAEGFIVYLNGVKQTTFIHRAPFADFHILTDDTYNCQSSIANLWTLNFRLKNDKVVSSYGAIDFRNDDDDILLHVAPQVREKKLILNSIIDGEWGKEEVLPLLDINASLTLTVEVAHDGYLLHYESGGGGKGGVDIPPYLYKHRQSWQQLCTASVQGEFASIYKGGRSYSETSRSDFADKPDKNSLTKVIIDADVDGITVSSGKTSAAVGLKELIELCNSNPAYKGLVYQGDERSGEQYWFVGELASTVKSPDTKSPGKGLPYTRAGCRLYYKAAEDVVSSNISIDTDVDGITLCSNIVGTRDGLAQVVATCDSNFNSRGVVFQPDPAGGGTYWLISSLLSNLKSRSSSSPGPGIPYRKSGSYLYVKPVVSRCIRDADVDGVTLAKGSVPKGQGLKDIIDLCNNNPLCVGVVYHGDMCGLPSAGSYWLLKSLNSTVKSTGGSRGSGLPYQCSGSRLYYKVI